MRILIAEDDLVSRRALEATLLKWGYEVTVTCDGHAAWQSLQRDDTPPVAVLDWMMPGLDGPELCRRVRALSRSQPLYLILLTARNRPEDIVAGLQSGADDYVTKPFNREELQARLQVARRIVELQQSLAARVRDLEAALARVKQLHGMLPICCYCKKVRSDQDYWQQVEAYITSHSDLQFSHGICPGCFETVVKPQLEQQMAPVMRS